MTMCETIHYNKDQLENLHEKQLEIIPNEIVKNTYQLENNLEICVPKSFNLMRVLLSKMCLIII